MAAVDDGQAPLLQAQGLVKQFRRRRVVSDVTIELSAGEISVSKYRPYRSTMATGENLERGPRPAAMPSAPHIVFNPLYQRPRGGNSAGVVKFVTRMANWRNAGRFPAVRRMNDWFWSRIGGEGSV